MAIKKTGISRDLIIHPGETIADILEARNMTQAELAVRTGVSSAFIGSVIAGRKDISSKFAMALEYALEVPKSFWLNLQARYDAELLEFDEENTISTEEMKIRKDLNDVVKHLRKLNIIPIEEDIQSIITLRKIFKVSSLCNLEKIPSASAFRISSKNKIDPCILGAWIRMCQINECKFEEDKTFDPNEIDNLVTELKKLMLSNSAESLNQEIKTVLYNYGLDFEIVKHFRGAPVQGFLYKRADNRIKICMTIRGAFADIFWFSLFHELGHLYNGDLSKSSKFLDDGNDKIKEDAADKFASDKLLDGKAYEEFISKYKNAPSYELIKNFAFSQNVPPFIVIGRMQKKHIIKYQEYAFAKTRYKWI